MCSQKAIQSTTQKQLLNEWGRTSTVELKLCKIARSKLFLFWILIWIFWSLIFDANGIRQMFSADAIFKIFY